jgi:hypothetical protein
MKKTIYLSVWTILCLSGFLAGMALGGLFSTLSPARLGFWSQTATDSDLRVTLLRHVILSPTRIRTTIQLNNVGVTPVNANITLFYRDSLGDNLNTYNYNITINGGSSDYKIFIVDLPVAQWVTTDISIEEL